MSMILCHYRENFLYIIYCGAYIYPLCLLLIYNKRTMSSTTGGDELSALGGTCSSSAKTDVGKSKRSASTIALEQLTTKVVLPLKPVANKKKRSLDDLRQLVWEKEQAIQKSLKRTQESIMLQHAANKKKSCCILFDCIRNACKVQQLSVFKLSDIVRILLDYKNLVDILSMDDPKKRVKVELKELIYRLVELVPEFISIEDHSTLLNSDAVEPTVNQKAVVNENLNSNVLVPPPTPAPAPAPAPGSSTSDPKLYVRVNLLCSYSSVRDKLKNLTRPIDNVPVESVE